MSCAVKLRKAVSDMKLKPIETDHDHEEYFQKDIVVRSAEHFLRLTVTDERGRGTGYDRNTEQTARTVDKL